jgi:hypothetical protein
MKKMNAKFLLLIKVAFAIYLSAIFTLYLALAIALENPVG